MSSIALGVTPENSTPNFPNGMTTLNAFLGDAGKTHGIANFYANLNDWIANPSWGGFDTSAFANFSGTLMISLHTAGWPLASIAAGAQDATLTKLFASLAAYGKPILFRPNWEMNGTWMPWGVGANGNTAADYVASWRHLHDLAAAAKAANLLWVWCPNMRAPGDTGPSDFAPMYPGDAYVDAVGLDGYSGLKHPMGSFQTLFTPSLDQLRVIAPSRVILICETGAGEAGQSKAQWITDAYTWLRTQTTYPIVGVLWFNRDVTQTEGGPDWRIESSPASQAAYKAAIADPAYVSTFTPSMLIPATPIPTPQPADPLATVRSQIQSAQTALTAALAALDAAPTTAALQAEVVQAKTLGQQIVGLLP